MNVDKKDLLNINFPYLEYTNHQLIVFANKIFEYDKYLEELFIDKKILNNLLKDITCNYNVIPYHHFTHAYSVFHTLNCCFQQSKFNNYLS